jgi:hypothetical protein
MFPSLMIIASLLGFICQNSSLKCLNSFMNFRNFLRDFSPGKSSQCRLTRGRISKVKLLLQGSWHLTSCVLPAYTTTKWIS